VHSTRLSERRHFRSAGRPNGAFSTEWPIKRGLAVEMTLRGRDDGAFLRQGFRPPSELGNPQRTRLSTFPQRRRLPLSNRDKLLNPRQSYISTDSRAEPINQWLNHRIAGTVITKASVERRSIEAASDWTALYRDAKSTTTVARGKAAAHQRLTRERTNNVQQMQ
jgi:hypothetical protein